MSDIDAYSTPIKNGENSLSQVSAIIADDNPNTEMRARVSYFNFTVDPNKEIEIGSFGFKMINENDLPALKKRYSEIAATPSELTLLDQVTKAFEQVRSKNSTLSTINTHLKAKTEQFYQTYISGRTIKQTFNPIGLEDRKKEAKNAENPFMARRHVQKIQERVGVESVIPTSHVRNAWGLG